MVYALVVTFRFHQSIFWAKNVIIIIASLVVYVKLYHILYVNHVANKNVLMIHSMAHGTSLILRRRGSIYKIEFLDEDNALKAVAHLQNSGATIRQLGKAVLVGPVHSTLLAEVMVKYKGYTVDPQPCDSL